MAVYVDCELYSLLIKESSSIKDTDMDISKIKAVQTAGYVTIVSVEAITLKESGVTKLKCTTVEGVTFWLFPSEVLRGITNFVGSILEKKHLTILAGAKITWEKAQVCVQGQTYTRFNSEETFTVDGDTPFLDSFRHGVSLDLSTSESVTNLKGRLELLALMPSVAIFDPETDMVAQTSVAPIPAQAKEEVPDYSGAGTDEIPN